MDMGPRLHKLALAVHITASVGWVGAVLAYLPLDLTTRLSQDAPTLRAAYFGMNLVAVWAIFPLALAAFATGLVVALGTRWGLFRHYWVLISLLLTTFAVVVLQAEMRTIGALARVAADPATSDAALRALPSTLPHSVGGLLVLLVVLALNVAKPRGLTKRGRRQQREERAAPSAGASAQQE